MASTESPAVARRRLRLALRKAREAAGRTQGQVADALDWSLSKIQRIEGGEVTVSGTDLTALLRELDVTDAHTVRELGERARAARNKGWWDAPKYRDHLTPGTVQLIQFENEAHAISCFQATLVPGIMQTPAYARTALNFSRDDLAEDDIDVRLEVRLNRAKHLFGRQDSPYYRLILDESVIWREVGGLQAMADQLQTLLSLVRDKHVDIRILPLVESGVAGMIGPFMIFRLDEENSVLYRESAFEDEIVQSGEVVTWHQSVFERLWGYALDELKSQRVLEARLATVLVSLDRLSLDRGRYLDARSADPQ